MNNREFNEKRMELVNAVSGAAQDWLAYMGTDAALAAISNTEPPRYVVAGALSEIVKLLPGADSIRDLLASTAAEQAEPKQVGAQLVKHGDVPRIEITLRQAKELVDCFGGSDAEISIIERPAAWADMPDGLYAYFSEYPDEGSMYLGPTEVRDEDEQAPPASPEQVQAESTWYKPLPTPDQLLAVARDTGLRSYLHGVNSTEAKEILSVYIDAVRLLDTNYLPSAAAPIAAAPAARADHIEDTRGMVDWKANAECLLDEVKQLRQVIAGFTHGMEHAQQDTAPEQDERARRFESKLDAVWTNLRAMVEKYSGKACDGEPIDALDALLAGRAAPAAEQVQDEVRNQALEDAAKVADVERAEFMSKSGDNNGRESDFAFGSVNSAERIAATIRAMKTATNEGDA